MFEGMQLEDWTRLSGLTGLALRGVRASHHGTLAAVLPRLTELRSLVLEKHGEEQLRAAGGLCSCCNLMLQSYTFARGTKGDS
jgi:hypothetical protein